MFRLMFAVALAILSGNASAGTDFQCMSRCQDKGYMYSYCKSQCTYGESDSSSQQEKIKSQSTDYKCLNDCTAKGSLYGYCKEKCSY